MKNDERDATEIAHRLRRNDLPEAWIAPPQLRDLRELVRYRAKLVALRSGLKAQVHAVLAKQGVVPKLDDLFGPEGQRFLDDTALDRGFEIRVESLRDLIELYDREIAILEPEIHRWLRDDAGYWAIQAIHGVGRTTAAIFVAEIGDVHRFPTARHLCSWAGLTPRHIESDTRVIRGRITRSSPWERLRGLRSRHTESSGHDIINSSTSLNGPAAADARGFGGRRISGAVWRPVTAAMSC